MEVETIIAISTFVVTIILGIISKKSEFVSNNVIPLQNVVVGLIVAMVEYFITKDFETSIAISGLLAGGTYDIVHNLNKIKNTTKIEEQNSNENN